MNKIIGLLCKIRHYVPKFLLKTLYYTIFHPHLIYACQIWGQNINTLNKIQAPQVKAVRIINFRANSYDVAELYKNDKMLKISDYIKLLNCLFVRDVLKISSILPFQKDFIKSENLRQYNTRHVKQNSVILTQRNTNCYGIKSIRQHGISFQMKQAIMFCKTLLPKSSLQSSLPIKYLFETQKMCQIFLIGTSKILKYSEKKNLLTFFFGEYCVIILTSQLVCCTILFQTCDKPCIPLPSLFVSIVCDNTSFTTNFCCTVLFQSSEKSLSGGS